MAGLSDIYDGIFDLDDRDVGHRAFTVLEERRELAIQAWIIRCDPIQFKKSISVISKEYLLSPTENASKKATTLNDCAISVYTETVRLERSVRNVISEYSLLKESVLNLRRQDELLGHFQFPMLNNIDLRLREISGFEADLNKFLTEIEALKSFFAGPYRDLAFRKCIDSLILLWGAHDIGRSFQISKNKEGIFEFSSPGPLFVQLMMGIIDPRINLANILSAISAFVQVNDSAGAF